MTALKAEKASLVGLMAKAAGDDSLLTSLRAAFSRADRELAVAEAARPDPAVRAGELVAPVDGGGYRVVPIFPELRPHLEDAWELAPDGAGFVVSGPLADRSRQKAKGWQGWMG